MLKVIFVSEAVAQRCSVKTVFLEISQNSHESTCARVSFLNKAVTPACSFIKKEALAQLFCCKFVRNFLEHLRQLLLSVVRYLNFCPDFLVMQFNGLMRKPQTIHKIMTIQILDNISRSKDNQGLKFGQLVEYKKYFLQKWCRKYSRKTSFRPLLLFFEKSFI